MQRLRCGVITSLSLAATLLLAACGSGGAGRGAPPSPPVQGTHITISNFMYSPMALTVSPGTTVRVTNEDTATHTLSATDAPFDTGDIEPGRTKTFTAPTKPGTYHYICNIHQYMMGTVTVK
ncbi:MAG TPA: cupredoxin domain-containing protein [Acidimicrobiales bacterium]|nr:cupredoxin domain-containing protein [Acidimicrobiales bacterium]